MLERMQLEEPELGLLGEGDGRQEQLLRLVVASLSTSDDRERGHPEDLTARVLGHRVSASVEREPLPSSILPSSASVVASAAW